MNRMIRGMAGLMVALGASACADDPSVEFGGDAPTKIQASPTVMFVNQGAREEILFRLVDDRNRSTPTSFEVSNVGAGITVELDDEYRPDYIGSDELEFNPIQHQHRYYVTANAPVGTSFTVSSGGISQVITVNVVPTEIPITITVAGGLATITSETFTFTAATTVEFDGLLQNVLSVSPDGHSIVVPVPGGGLTDEPPVISGAVAGYMPTVALAAAPGTTGVTAGPTMFGSATYPSATPITIPETDFTFTDRGDFVGADIFGQGGPNAHYRFIIPNDRHFDLTVSWAGGLDLDWLLLDADQNVRASAGAGGAGPEHASADLVAGTYDLVVINWCNGCTDTNPATFVQFHIAP
jgi:hypothetical protein